MPTEEKILYDYNSGELITKNKVIRFTYNENEIMRILIENKDCYVDTKTIIETVYGKDWRLYCNANIAVYIFRIRKITEEEYRRKGQGIYEI